MLLRVPYEVATETKRNVAPTLGILPVTWVRLQTYKQPDPEQLSVHAVALTITRLDSNEMNCRCVRDLSFYCIHSTLNWFYFCKTQLTIFHN